MGGGGCNKNVLVCIFQKINSRGDVYSGLESRITFATSLGLNVTLFVYISKKVILYEARTNDILMNKTYCYDIRLCTCDMRVRSGDEITIFTCAYPICAFIINIMD